MIDKGLKRSKRMSLAALVSSTIIALGIGFLVGVESLWFFPFGFIPIIFVYLLGLTMYNIGILKNAEDERGYRVELIEEIRALEER